MPGPLDALRSSTERLASLVARLDDEAVNRPAYPAEWSIADVMSHLGSGAVIYQRLLSDAVAGTPTSEAVTAAVWSEWDAKSPRAKVDDGVAADAAFLVLVDDVSPEDRARFSITVGPMTVGWDELIAMRLAEHVVHEWDVAVALDPAAVLATDATPTVLEQTELAAQWSARPAGDPRTVTLAVSDPEQTFSIVIGTDSVSIEAGVEVPPVDGLMPAESFIRLVYGRLDPEHTPASVVVPDDTILPQLRSVFPGL